MAAVAEIDEKFFTFCGTDRDTFEFLARIFLARRFSEGAIPADANNTVRSLILSHWADHAQLLIKEAFHNKGFLRTTSPLCNIAIDLGVAIFSNSSDGTFPPYFHNVREDAMAVLRENYFKSDLSFAIPAYLLCVHCMPNKNSVHTKFRVCYTFMNAELFLGCIKLKASKQVCLPVTS